MQKLFLTFFYSGLAPKAPGTFGTIAGAVVAIFILLFANTTTLFLLAFLLTVASFKIIDDYEKKVGKHDSSEIVIDEVAGVWLALSISSASILAFLLSVILFRVFDIAKPSIIGKIDKTWPGGYGVMLDDIVAGFFAGLSSLIIISLMQKFGLESWIF